MATHPAQLGYSPLDQIDRSNVARLQQVWSRPLGPGLREGTPLVHDGILFMPNPSDDIQAMNAATGELLWRYKRKWPDALRESGVALYRRRPGARDLSRG